MHFIRGRVSTVKGAKKNTSPNVIGLQYHTKYSFKKVTIFYELTSSNESHSNTTWTVDINSMTPTLNKGSTYM